MRFLELAGDTSASYYMRKAYYTLDLGLRSNPDAVAKKRMEAVGFLEKAASCLYGNEDCDEVNILKIGFLRLASIYLGYIYALGLGKSAVSSAGLFSLLHSCNMKNILNPVCAFTRDRDGETKYLHIDFDDIATSSDIESLVVDLSTYWNGNEYSSPLRIISTALMKAAPADGPFFFYDKYVRHTCNNPDIVSQNLTSLLLNPPTDDLITGEINDMLTDCNTFLKALAFFSMSRYAYYDVWNKGYGRFTKLGEDDMEVVKTMRMMLNVENIKKYHGSFINDGLPFSFEWLPDKDDPNKFAYCRTGTKPVNSWDMKAKALGIIGY